MVSQGVCHTFRFCDQNWHKFEMQFAHFSKFAKDKCDPPHPVERYTTEAKRLLGVLEKRLERRDFLIDAGYTIADMATFPWIAGIKVSEALCTIYVSSFSELGCFVFPNKIKGDRHMQKDMAAQLCLTLECIRIKLDMDF